MAATCCRAAQGRTRGLPLVRDWSLASAYHTRDWAQGVQNKILVELKGRGTVGERNLFRRGTWVATWLPQAPKGLGSGRNGWCPAPRPDLSWPGPHRGARPPAALPHMPLHAQKNNLHNILAWGGQTGSGHTGQEVEGGGTRLRSPPSD